MDINSIIEKAKEMQICGNCGAVYRGKACPVCAKAVPDPDKKEKEDGDKKDETPKDRSFWDWLND